MQGWWKRRAVEREEGAYQSAGEGHPRTVAEVEVAAGERRWLRARGAGGGCVGRTGRALVSYL